MCMYMCTCVNECVSSVDTAGGLYQFRIMKTVKLGPIHYAPLGGCRLDSPELESHMRID